MERLTRKMGKLKTDSQKLKTKKQLWPAKLRAESEQL